MSGVDAIATLRGNDDAPAGYRIVEELDRRSVLTDRPPYRRRVWVIERTVALERIALTGTPGP